LLTRGATLRDKVVHGSPARQQGDKYNDE
jgi:hypothetical protein